MIRLMWGKFEKVFLWRMLDILFRRDGVMGCSRVGFLFMVGFVGSVGGYIVQFFILLVMVYIVLAMG